MDVIVVGGGIGGLSLALSLHQAGIKVRVYEAVSNPGPLGVGINLQPTAVRELTELGLGDELAQAGIAVQRLVLFNKFGQLISEEPRGLLAGFRWPQYAIHRGRLQQLLLRAVRSRIGEENVCTGFRLLGFEQDRDRVTATFRDDASEADITCSATILLGSEGLHSTVRRTLYPNEGEPCFARQVLWRASVDAEPFLDGRTQIIAGHLHQRIILYPMARSPSNNLLTNWICQMTVPETSFPREDWSRRVSKEKLLASFSAWRFPWLDLPELIEQTSDIFEFPLMDLWSCYAFRRRSASDATDRRSGRLPGHCRRTSTDRGIDINFRPRPRVAPLRRRAQARYERNRSPQPEIRAGSIVTAGRRAGAKWL